jgi:hypothetical protein
MAIPIPSPLIEFILLGPQEDRRQLQDSPVLGDVWIEFGKDPSGALDLLIAPYRGQHAGVVAAAIHERLSVGLRLLPPQAASDAFPEKGRNEVVLALVDQALHVRIFDADGRFTDDVDEAKLGGVKDHLKGLWPPHRLTAAEKEQVIAAVGSATGQDFGEREADEIAHLQGLVVARLSFERVLRVVVPMTRWWIDRWDRPDERPTKRTRRRKDGDARASSPPPRHRLEDYTASRAEKTFGTILDSAKEWLKKTGGRAPEGTSSLDRFAALTGLILWAGGHLRPGPPAAPATADEQMDYILKHADAKDLAQRFVDLVAEMLPGSLPDDRPSVYQVSLNRVARPALRRSIPAVKGDAAKTLFKVDCSKIVWAIVDSGVEGSHPAFAAPNPRGTGPLPSRVQRSFDFKDFRKILSLGNSSKATRERNLAELLGGPAKAVLCDPPGPEEADRFLSRLAEDARSGGPIQWELVRRFVEIKPGARPRNHHGTHVAGILGASKEAAQQAAGDLINDDFADGMCPDIGLYDFRVLGADVRDTEFAIIAALQFLRYLNSCDNFLTIHGANLSLSIPHDVRNYACGRTPICEECERLVESGVVVVAAAGNHGYQSYQTRDGSYEGYAAFSITDPGNSEGVITVGSTHRFWPHTYGVSFFSSRGPTGDGRLKPDLVAPGERIRAPIPAGDPRRGGDWGDLDGTSMAAPHVSGAAAMLMGRYSELIGQPRRIKRILCDSATDLGRERSFQGHGMLDVLRAFQSI